MTGILRAFGALFFNTNGSVSSSKKNRQSQPAAEEASRGTVLAIDDDPKMLDALRRMLRAEGFTVLTATSGAKGLDLLRYCQRDVRIVILDYSMPILSGAETLAYVRKLNPSVKVVALTGMDPNMLPESFRTGADKVLLKPCTNGQLLDCINQLLGFDPNTALQKP